MKKLIQGVLVLAVFLVTLEIIRRSFVSIQMTLGDWFILLIWEALMQVIVELNIDRIKKL